MSRENPNINVHDQLSIPQLRSAISGQVITPGDAEYDEARSVFYGKFDARPAMIVQPANASKKTNAC